MTPKVERQVNGEVLMLFLFLGTPCFSHLAFVNTEFSKTFPEMNKHEKTSGRL